jgi:hypothetical protein
MLAHPPNPNPTTRTHTTINELTTNIAVQLGKKNGGFSAAFCKTVKNKKVNLNPTPSTNLLASGDFFHGKKAKLDLKLVQHTNYNRYANYMREFLDSLWC